MFARLAVACRGLVLPTQCACRPVLCRYSSGDPGPPVEPDDMSQPPIPTYKVREGESTDTRRARLVYQSRKRGLLENGLLLSTFASRHLKNLNEKQLDMYDNIINQPSNDWDIYYWQTGKAPTPTEYDNEVMDMLKKHAKNEENEERFEQPPL